MEANASSRRSNKSDFYITPFPCIRALLDKIELSPYARILDPCSGTGVIGKVLREYGFVNYKEYDIVEGRSFYEESGMYDVIIANPPYSEKNKFIDKALTVAKDVYMILPMNVVNYNIFHRNYLNWNEYQGRYLMAPKFFMTQDETENPKRGGISSYAWFHWSKKNNNNNCSYECYMELEKYFRKE